MACQSRIARLQGFLAFVADQVLQFWPPYRTETEDGAAQHLVSADLPATRLSRPDYNPARLRQHRCHDNRIERGTTVKTLGAMLTAASLLGLAVAGAATPRTGDDTWIGVWGYVIAPPAPGPAPAPFVVPTPPVTPLGIPPATAAPTAARTFPAPLLENPGNVPVDVATAEIRNTTVRQLVRVSADGTRLRLRFSNEDSPDPLTLGAVHVGLAAADGAVVAGTDHVVTFGGHSGIVIPASAPALSDDVSPDTNPGVIPGARCSRPCNREAQQARRGQHCSKSLHGRPLSILLSWHLCCRRRAGL